MYMPEPDGNATHGLVGAARENQLTHAFRGAHDARGVHSFIRRNHYETHHGVPFGNVQQAQKSKNVVLDSLLNVAFHDRNVFIRCRMEDDLGTLAVEENLHTFRIADVSHAEE